MTTESSAKEVDARQWASKTLRHVSSQPPTDISSLLRLVTESGLVLSETETNAVQILGDACQADRRSIADRAGMQERYERRVTALEDFKHAFFDLTCLERCQRWQSMAGECPAFPNLIARLNRLKPGLNVTCPQAEIDSKEQYLLQMCRRVFLASPLEAAQYRRIVCQQWQANLSGWEDAVDELLDNHGDFLQAIAPWLDAFGERVFRGSESRQTPDVRVVKRKKHVIDLCRLPRVDSHVERFRTDEPPLDSTTSRFATLGIVITMLVLIGTPIIMVVHQLNDSSQAHERDSPVRPTFHSPMMDMTPTEREQVKRGVEVIRELNSRRKSRDDQQSQPTFPLRLPIHEID